VGDNSYLYMSQVDFYGADNTQGTVEIFLKKRMQRAIPFETPLPAIFGVIPYSSGPMGFGRALEAYWSDGYTGNGGLQFGVNDSNGIAHFCNDLGWDDVPMNRFVHVAFVWDLNGIDGSADKLRIYREGKVVCSNADAFDALKPDDAPVPVLGNHAYSRLTHPALIADEIYVWDQAITKF